jgi:uncharacterized protein (DUF58 family)
VPEEAVARIDIALRRRMIGVLSGEHLAAGAAEGLELVQLRAYVPGDDVRRLDAAASARTGVAHIRLQVPERAVVTWLVLDVSASMAFGSAGRLKSDVTEGVAEVCARLAIRRGGRVAAALAGASGPFELQPLGGRPALGAVRSLVRRGVAGDGARRVRLGDALARVSRLARTRAAVIVVSDFRDECWAGALSALGARHAVLGVEVTDPLEAELPDAGPLLLRDPESGELVELDTSDARVRAAFASAESSRRDGVASTLRRAGARHIALSTGADWLRELGRVTT